MKTAYFTSAGAFLPGPPVGNDEIEAVLGLVFGKPSRLRKRVLAQNKIETRHYALDREQRATHQAEELAALAIEACLAKAPVEKRKVDLLACATTQGDLLLPGFASQVQARIGLPAVEIITTHGICGSGMMAVKAAANAVRLGESRNALVCATELASRNLKASRYEAARAGGDDGRLDFDSEFLRWMLSDGAAAFLLQDKPAPRGTSLRVDWIRMVSHAGAYPLCMRAGRSPREGAPPSWQDYRTYAEAEADGALLIRQEMRLLDDVVKVGCEQFVRLVDEGVVEPAKVDHFLCHYSSHFFRGRIVELLAMAGAMIPEERWFTNLYSKGNTGCAALLIMLEEALSSGRVRPGQSVLCFVPESGRFNSGFMHLTAVEGEAS